MQAYSNMFKDEIPHNYFFNKIDVFKLVIYMLTSRVYK